MIMVTEPQNQFESLPIPKQPSPVPPLKIASLMFLLFGFYFLIFAMVQFIINTHEHNYRLSLSCQDRNCSAETPSLVFAEGKPVNIYLKTEVFEKDINIINSFSPSQLQGKYFQDHDHFSCFNTLTNAQMNKGFNVHGDPLDPDAVAFPCGQRLFRFPEGTIQLFSFGSQTVTSMLPKKTVNPYARDTSYSNSNLSLQWIDVNQPQFVGWMTELSSRDTSMYWGQLNKEISGLHRISYLLSADSYVGNYQLILTDSMTFGGVNSQLCYINLTMSIICFACAIVAYLANRKSTKVFDIE